MSGTGKIFIGKSEEVLKGFADNSVDSCVTDPPYGLKFMGKKWDYEVPKVELWKEVYRVLKPGAHILVACGTRTQHRMAVNIEDAGFEIRDVITWHYGSGFPKSLDISKAIDKRAGAEREKTGEMKLRHGGGKHSKNIGQLNPDAKETPITAPATEEAKLWNGWGTALKPSTEFWTLARKPLSENTVAENVLKHGTGGINIDVCRVEIDPTIDASQIRTMNRSQKDNDWGMNASSSDSPMVIDANKGRFPANLILDEFMASELDKQSGVLTSGHMNTVSQGKNYGIYGKYNGKEVYAEGDSGGASRFFYCAKASRTERNKGLKYFYWRRDSSVEYGFVRITKEEYEQLNESDRAFGNIHPTVKPVSLMKYLIKLITPKDGVVIDMFAGSGTTGVAADELEIDYVLIDKFKENCEMAEARIPKIKKQKDLFS